MTVVYKRRAQADVSEAMRWYNAQRKSLDVEFLEELEDIIDMIQLHPLLYPKVHREFRCARLRRFPYSVYYQIESDVIYVFAVFHHRQDTQKLFH